MMIDRGEKTLGSDCLRFQDLIEKKVIDGYDPADFEKEFLGAHGSECIECGRLAETIESLANDDEYGMDVERDSIHAILNLSFANRRKRRRLASAAAAAILFLTASATIVWTLRNDGTSEDSLRIALVRGHLLVSDGEIVPGQGFDKVGRFATSDEEPAVVSSDERLFIALSKKTAMRVVSSSKSAVCLRLDQGRIAVHLIPGSGVKLEVLVPEGRIEVRGTVFTVDTEDKNTRVGVVKGTVAVESSRWSDSAPLALRAGWSLFLASRVPTPLKGHQDNDLLALLGLSQNTSTSDSTSPRSPIVVVDSAQHPDASEDKAAENQLPIRAHEKPRIKRPSPETLIQLARACRSEMDWECAAANYRKVIQWYPKRADSVTAMVPLGQILLDRLRKPADALKYFQLYRQRRPKGGLAEEAAWGECSALRKLGRRIAERECLLRFSERYPKSLLMATIKERLEQTEQ